MRWCSAITAIGFLMDLPLAQVNARVQAILSARVQFVRLTQQWARATSYIADSAHRDSRVYSTAKESCAIDPMRLASLETGSGL